MQNEPITSSRRPLWKQRGPRLLLLAIIVVLVGMQFVRFVVPNFALDNPPVTYEVTWSSPEAEQLFNDACADCHSNETVYPFYAYVAPIGWLVASDINRGRASLNVSTNHHAEAHEMIEQIERGEMPLFSYTILHPEASLSDTEKETLINGILATFPDGERENRGSGQDEDGD